MSSIYKEIEITELAQHMADDDYDVLRIKIHFPHAEICKKTISLMEEYKLINKDNYAGYKAIGLQYDDDENQLYDAVNSITYIAPSAERTQLRKLGGTYIKKNNLGQQFEEFFRVFNQVVYLIRGRIITAEPGCAIREHTDGTCCAALHYVIATDPLAQIYIEDRPYHLPADGYFYLINASRRHHIKNMSSVNRTHIIFPLNPACFQKISALQFLKMRAYFDEFGLDVSRFKHLTVEKI